MTKFFNGPRVVRGSQKTSSSTQKERKPFFSVKNQENPATPTEILIYDEIVPDYFDDDGLSAKYFADVLKTIPSDKEIVVGINSPGGNVWDGMAIYNMLQARKDKVICRIDGVAASIASVIAMAGRECQMPSNALMMMHDPSGMAYGDAEEMRAMATKLDTHKEAIASVYQRKSGMAMDKIKELMSAETWMTGKDAKENGMCDVLLDQVTIEAKFNLSGFRRVPENLVQNKTPSTEPRPGGAKSNEDTQVNRDKIVALLKKHGISVDDKATEEQLLAQLEEITKKKVTEQQATNAVNPQDVVNMQTELATMKAERAAEKKTKIAAVVDSAIRDSRIPANDREKYIDLAVKDEGVLDMIGRLPSTPPGADPVRPIAEITSESITDISSHIIKNSSAKAHARGAQPIEVRNCAVVVAQTYWKHRDKIRPVLNAGTNTINADLQRIAILQEMLRAFKRRITRLNIFSTVFLNVPLQGTDKVAVPYYPLESAASTDFNGTYAFGDTDTEAKDVTINKRKYQALKVTSKEVRRQPYLNLEMLALLKAEKLAVDVWLDVLSVITNANFGAAALTTPAAGFGADQIADLRKIANQADWPETGRSIVIDSAYDANLLKDPSVRAALNFGSDRAIQSGVVGNIYGFDYIENPRIPGNAENLVGFITQKNPILVATAPIQPTEEIAKVLYSYELVVDPDAGIAFEYRRWGSPDDDSTKEVVEANYGYDLGVTAGLKRIVSA